jgi:hypothetical protein
MLKRKKLYISFNNYSVSFLNKRKFYKYKIHFLQTFGIREPESHGKVIVGHLWRFSRNVSSFSISSAESLKVMSQDQLHRAWLFNSPKPDTRDPTMVCLSPKKTWLQVRKQCFLVCFPENKRTVVSWMFPSLPWALISLKNNENRW